MNILLIIFIPLFTSFVVSFLMMKFQMRMISKWMDEFFEKETNYIKKLIKHKHL